MRCLLDTNIFLWWLNGDKKLDTATKKVIADPKNLIYISVANAWEISIKHKKGKLPLKTTLKRCFEIANFPILNINFDHILKNHSLPLIHRDPFDRILISQAIVEGLQIITNDNKIWKYDVRVIRA